MILKSIKGYVTMTVPALASLALLAKSGFFSKSIDKNKYPDLPNSTEEFNSFPFTNDGLANLYTENLSIAKENGVVSDNLLQQFGITDPSQINAVLESLYQSGKAGSIEAQTKFNELASAYANDFYLQASNQTYLDLVGSLPQATFDILGNIQDNPALFIGAVGLASVGIIIGNRMIKNEKYR